MFLVKNSNMKANPFSLWFLIPWCGAGFPVLPLDLRELRDDRALLMPSETTGQQEVVNIRFAPGDREDVFSVRHSETGEKVPFFPSATDGFTCLDAFNALRKNAPHRKYFFHEAAGGFPTDFKKFFAPEYAPHFCEALGLPSPVFDSPRARNPVADEETENDRRKREVSRDNWLLLHPRNPVYEAKRMQFRKGTEPAK
ncbi:unnamed protein product [Amoebophrya sp. A25]|nr:unnamed protein product [Amoebophrya sp. A25]|eukprot:GSA25T00001756001.1